MFYIDRKHKINFSFHSVSFLLTILISHLVQCSDVTKCCSSDSYLEFQTDSAFRCVQSDNLTTLSGYNVISSNETSFPQCSYKLTKSLFGGDNEFVRFSGCIDQMSNGDIVGLSCSTTLLHDLHLLNKCCPVGYSYDSSERYCIPNPNYLLNFQNVFGDSLILFQNKVPNCADDEVFVEYFSTEHDIFFDQAILTVNNEQLQSQKLCVDGSVNNESDSENTKHIIVRSCRPRSVCKQIACIRRCCKNDQMLQRINNKGQCVQHPNNANIIPDFYSLEFPFEVNKTQKREHVKAYGILHSLECPNEKFIVDNDGPDSQHFLHENGTLFFADAAYDVDNYCIENVKMRSISLRTFLCFGESSPMKFQYYPVGLTISCVFLAMTLVVYLSLPKLLNLHGKTLVCYVISFLFAYMLLAIVQFNTKKRMDFCREIAYVLYYFFMGVFCWQTVMCMDIYLTFGSLRSSFVMRHNKRNQRRFWYYSIYAWGMPLLLTLFTISAQKYEIFPTPFNPTLGEKSCFFMNKSKWQEHFVYFVLPAGIHILINLILFIITAIHCSRIKNEIHRMQCDTDESNVVSRRKKFLASRAMFVFTMNLKLFTVMGISWVFEIISTYSTNPIAELLQDTYNIFLGVFIFFIFVFKRKVIHEFKSRIGILPKHTGSATPRSTTLTNTVNIAMKEMPSARENRISMTKSANELPLLASSSFNLPKVN